MTETLTPAAPAADTDWWGRLYDELHADTHQPVIPAPAPSGHRLPPPGQVLDLDQPADPGEDDNEFADELADDADADALYEEFDDSDEPSPDDESDEPRQRAPRRPLRQYVFDHGDQERRFRRLVYNTTAAAAGWGLGLSGWAGDLLHECAASTGSPLAAVFLGAGFVAAALMFVDRRTRGWWAPLAWCCRIPLASAALALGLFTPSIAL